jgi:predicted ATPase/DNA-binding XRE family transcriptional regulator
VRKQPDDNPGVARGATPAGAAAFGDLLREYRVRAGFSQEQLAERAQMSAAAIGSLERGIRRTPYRSTVSLLVKALTLNEEDGAALGASRTGKRSEPVRGDAASYPKLQRASFVGRDADIAHIVKLFDKSRLVTLTGSGGIGKTRAALESEERLVGTRWDEAWFVDLSPLTDGAVIHKRIASTIQPPLTGHADTLSTLASALAKRRMLLILDNCEHLVTDAARAADTILKSCPDIAILATSREPLNISGEFVYRLPSLSVPGSTPNSLEEAHSYSAIDLFVQRAEAADPLATFDADSLLAIVNIARRLGGVPLAIELAAAQLPMLGLQTLEARLEDHFNIPAGRRDLPPRQQTVSATIRWSYGLLEPAERDLLCSVSVFLGGFTLEAAEAVGATDSLDRSAVLPLLSSLVNTSLVNIEHMRDDVRYTLLDSVRSFGLDRLVEAGTEEAALRRHAQWLAAVADDFCKRYDMLPPELCIALLPDVDNIRAAIAWGLNASSQDDRALAGRIIPGVAGIWNMMVGRTEYRHWIEIALERIDETRHPLVVARLLREFIARAVWEQVVLAAIDRAIPLIDSIDDPHTSMDLHSIIGSVLAWHGKLAQAQQSSECAFALLRSNQLESSIWHANLLLNRSQLRVSQGRLDDARADVSDAAAIALSLGDRYFVVCRCHPRLCLIEYAAGHPRLALEWTQQMLDSEFRTSPHVIIQALTPATTLRILLGDLSAAADSTRQLLNHTYSYESLVHPCTHAARTLAQSGEAVAAARLVGYVRTLGEPMRFSALEQAGDELLSSSLHRHLGDEDLATAIAKGAMLTRDQAIAEAHAALDRVPLAREATT